MVKTMETKKDSFYHLIVFLEIPRKRGSARFQKFLADSGYSRRNSIVWERMFNSETQPLAEQYEKISKNIPRDGVVRVMPVSDEDYIKSAAWFAGRSLFAGTAQNWDEHVKINMQSAGYSQESSKLNSSPAHDTQRFGIDGVDLVEITEDEKESEQQQRDELEDVDEVTLSFAEIKGLCAGDDRIREKMQLEVEGQQEGPPERTPGGVAKDRDDDDATQDLDEDASLYYGR